ncbi:DUF456 domain-containing protein [Alkaliphilus transvaalensis]|uniref:DUF456 domain-containing protein n=1 Tax=Alkaliphilus transvaalensis TaxID=114628 RepID=UPI00047DF4D7|nr:DUF456 domain-containing protein [Alkaliphilus transvaalensis]
MDYYLLISGIIIVLGIVGIFTAFLPGTLLVLAGIIFYGWSTDFTVISIKMIIFFGFLTLAGILFDYLASFISAKRYNISTKGIWGMLLGGVAGFFILSVIGMIIGQFIGILVGEILAGKNFKNSIKSGTASLVGYLLSTVVNIIIVGIMLGYFLFRLVARG